MKYALLIDSENAEPRMDEIFQELSKYGDTPIRYLVGNFTQNSTSYPWLKICQKHAITCVQTMNFTKGKNSLDISLVIEGMRLLYEKSFIDGVIIVASDSDYTPLAREWRNAGKEVIGIGRKLTPESYRASCTKFIYVENIFNKMSAKDEDDNEIASLEKLAEVMDSVLNENNGMAQLSVVVESIHKTYTDFDVRNYGFQKARDFFSASFKHIKLTEEKKNSFFISFKDVDEKKPEVKKEESQKEIQKAVEPKKETTPKEKTDAKSIKDKKVETKKKNRKKEDRKPKAKKPEKVLPKEVFEVKALYDAEEGDVTFTHMTSLCKKNHIDFKELGYKRFRDLLKDAGLILEGTKIKPIPEAKPVVADKIVQEYQLDLEDDL